MTETRGEPPRDPARSPSLRDRATPASAPARPATVQCRIPSTVAAVVSIETVKFRARVAGVRDASLVFADLHPLSGRTNVIATPDTAVFLLDEIHHQAMLASDLPDPAKPDLEYDCARAIVAVAAAIERAT